MITSTRGMIDETTLRKVEGIVDNDNEYTTWVEYYDPETNELLHRSANVALKSKING
jgi:hypothetical protein